MKQHKYPEYFYEQIRIDIAVSQVQHDCRKLFPSLPEKEWKNIDKDIKGWFSGDKFELEPAHDFWNFFGAFARALKLKSLLSWVTAENIIWQREEVPLKQVVYTWDFPGLEFMGKYPFSAGSLMRELQKEEMKEKRRLLEKESRDRSKRFMKRDQFRILVFHDQKGGTIDRTPGYYILEGNRRTTKAVLGNKKTIPAFVARFKNDKDKWPKNYWIDTGILRDLIFLSMGYNKQKDKDAFSVVRKFYQLLLRDFNIARFATFDKSFKNFERDEKLLLEIFLEDLK